MPDIYAKLPNGEYLKFPDGTDPAVIQKAVKTRLGQSQATTSDDTGVLASLNRNLNPWEIAKNIGTLLTTSPKTTIVDLMDRQLDIAQQRRQDAINEWQSGHPIRAALAGTAALGHQVAGYVPMYGPAAAGVVERGKEGDFGGAVTDVMAAIFGPEIISKTTRGLANVTGLSNAPAATAEIGLNLTKSIQNEYPNTNFGETALKTPRAWWGGRSVTANRVQNAITGIEEGLVDDARQAKGTANATAVAGGAERYADKLGQTHIGNSTSAAQRSSIAGNKNAFLKEYEIPGERPVTVPEYGGQVQNPTPFMMQLDKHLKGPFSYIKSVMEPTMDWENLNTEELLALKRKSGRQASDWRNSGEDPSRVNEFWKQGESLSARDQMEGIFKNEGFGSAVERLKQEQDFMAVLDILNNRGSSQIGKMATTGAVVNDPAKGLRFAAALKIVRSPFVMGLIGGGMQDVGRALSSEELIRAAILSGLQQ